MTTTFHQLPAALFDGLAGGAGGPDAIRELRAAQLSKHMLLIRHLLGRWPGPAGEGDAIAEALERVRSASPEQFAEVIGAPLVGAWAAIATRAVEQGSASRADFTHLGALTVVACAATGEEAAAEIPVHGGLAVLPGLGAVGVDAGVPVRAVSAGGRIIVRADTSVEVPLRPGNDAPGWLPVRLLDNTAAGRRMVVTLDDLHPYRHGHHVPPALRLPAAEIRLWRALFADAWQLLAENLPGRADELIAGLRTLVPLHTEEKAARSATIRHAFGVFGLSRPPSAAEFAVTIVHEFQHSKLSALLDTVELTDPDDRGRYFAPWRTDPRPLPGLLQGVYAFAGVADTWRALRGVPALAEEAIRQFADARLQVDRGLTAIEQSNALTRTGETLVARLRDATDAMLAEPVSRDVARSAERRLELTYRRWADQNGR
jgi:HEXXH motif-containing protein